MTDPVDHRTPVSIERIRNGLKSASFWVNELPRFADGQQRRAVAPETSWVGPVCPAGVGVCSGRAVVLIAPLRLRCLS